LAASQSIAAFGSSVWMMVAPRSAQKPKVSRGRLA
jgi:hypothetical protein